MELVVLLAVTLSVIGLAGRLPEARRVKRELARSPLDTMDRLPDDKQVTVRGIVEPINDDATTVAPISARTAVYWRLVFDEVGVGEDFRELGRTEVGRPFLLTSQTGNARVVPEQPRLALPGRAVLYRVADLDDPTRNDGALRLARAICKRPNYPTSALRVTEYAVTPGTEITVKGWCTHEPDPTAAQAVSGNYRGAAPTRPVISGSRRARLMIG